MTPWPPLSKQDHFFQDTICSATCTILLLKTDLEDHLSLKERLLHLLDHTSLAFIQVLLHRDLLHVHSVRVIYSHLKKKKKKSFTWEEYILIKLQIYKGSSRIEVLWQLCLM